MVNANRLDKKRLSLEMADVIGITASPLLIICVDLSLLLALFGQHTRKADIRTQSYLCL